MKNRITPKQFYNKHNFCPRCNNDYLTCTLMGVIEDTSKDFIDNLNIVRCENCGFKGNYLDLLEFRK